MAEEKWVDVGAAAELRSRPVTAVRAGRRLPLAPLASSLYYRMAERMNCVQNVAVLRTSRELREGAAALVERCVLLAGRLRASEQAPERVARGGRKAQALAAED